MPSIDPAYDVETLEEGDYKYLRKAIQNARKNKKTNPHRVMKFFLAPHLSSCCEHYSKLWSRTLQGHNGSRKDGH